jgi:hypothetical protein
MVSGVYHMARPTSLPNTKVVFYNEDGSVLALGYLCIDNKVTDLKNRIKFDRAAWSTYATVFLMILNSDDAEYMIDKIIQANKLPPDVTYKLEPM